MKYLSLFSGIGGFELGLLNSNYDFECVGYSEIDKYARSIYEKHYPNHTFLGDATKIKTKDLPDFDFLVGGFPCQAFSNAGLRRGFDDTRGTLFFEIQRILKDKRPKYFLLENVKGLLSHDKGKTFQTILKVLSNLRYDVKWKVHNSKDYGVPQNRERVFIEGYSRRECRGEVLHIRKNNESPFVKISNTWFGTRTGRVHCPDEHMNTLTAEGQNSGSRQWILEEKKELSADLCGEMAVKNNLNIIEPSDNSIHIQPMLKLRETTKKGYKEAYPNDGVLLDRAGRKIAKGIVHSGESGTLKTSPAWGTVTEDYRIRKLTPRECERLQAFPDDWTLYGKEGETISNTQRYKCIGNAVTTTVITAIVNEMFEGLN